MKLIVTGATGFIGQYFVKEADRLGYQIKANSLHGGYVNSVEVDALDLKDNKQVIGYFSKIRKIDAIIHIAASVPNSSNDQQTIDNSFIPNVIGTYNILKVVRSLGIKKFVFLSSCSIYGFQNVKLTENVKAKPENPYALSKYIGEIMGEFLLPETYFISLRLSAPYGPLSNLETVINRFVLKAINNEDLILYGRGEGKQDFIHISDIVKAIVQALKYQSSGIYNIASGESISMNSLAKLIISLVPNCSSKIFYKANPDLKETYNPKYDLSRSMRELGFVPKITLKKGLTHLINYFQKINK